MAIPAVGGYTTCTFLIPIARFSESGVACAALAPVAGSVVNAVWMVEAGLYWCYVGNMVSVTYFSFLKPTFKWTFNATVCLGLIALAEAIVFGTMAQYLPVAVNAFFTLALFGKLSFLDTDLALKIWAGWNIFNGVAGYLMPRKFMSGWEAPLNSDAEVSMAKFFCGVLGAAGLFMGAVAFNGADILKAAAVGWGAFLLTNLDGTFVTKSSEALGVDKNASLGWAAIQAAVVAFLTL